MTSRPRQTPSRDDLEDFRTYRRTRDRALRDDLVLRHIGLAMSLAARYSGRGQDPDDLRQVALVGLIKAVDRFDPDHGAAFSSFATPTILGELKRHFRDRGWTIRVPRRVQVLRRRAQAARQELEQAHGQAATTGEVARALGEPEDDVREALAAGSCYQPASLEERTRPDLPDTAGSSAATACDQVDVERLLQGLDPREQRIFVLRYYAGMTQQEIADRVGISQMHVSRLLRAGIEDMRAAAA